jgi:hypothetical protein
VNLPKNMNFGKDGNPLFKNINYLKENNGNFKCSHLKST